MGRRYIVTTELDMNLIETDAKSSRLLADIFLASTKDACLVELPNESARSNNPSTVGRKLHANFELTMPQLLATNLFWTVNQILAINVRASARPAREGEKSSQLRDTLPISKGCRPTRWESKTRVKIFKQKGASRIWRSMDQRQIGSWTRYLAGCL